MLHIKTILLKLVALATKNMLKQCKSWQLFWSADSAPSLQPQCCSYQCRGRRTHQRAGARRALGPVTGTMLALARKNLRIRRCGAAVLLLLLVIFLLHPGRFSVISVTSVTAEMVARARARYCHTHVTPSSSAAANLQLLHDLVAGAGAGAEQGGAASCEVGGSCWPASAPPSSLPRVALVVPFRDRDSQLAVFLPYM